MIEYMLIEGRYGERVSWGDTVWQRWTDMLVTTVDAVDDQLEKLRCRWLDHQFRAFPVTPTAMDQLDGPPPSWLRPAQPRPLGHHRAAARRGLGKRHPLMVKAYRLPVAPGVILVPWCRTS